MNHEKIIKEKYIFINLKLLVLNQKKLKIYIIIEDKKYVLVQKI